MKTDQAVVRLEDEDVKVLDTWVGKGPYETRSVFIRQAIRHYNKVLLASGVPS